MTEVTKIPKSAQIKAARSLISLTQEGLANMAEVSLSSVKKLEQLDPDTTPIIELRYKTVMQIVSFLEAQGIRFVSEENASGVILETKQEIHDTGDTNL